MKELEYPFDADWILKKKKSIKRKLLEQDNVIYINKKIAILGGSTTNDITNIILDNPLEWIDLANDDCFTVIVSTVGQWESDDLEYRAVMEQLKIDPDKGQYNARAYIGGYDHINICSDDEIEDVVKLSNYNHQIEIAHY